LPATLVARESVRSYGRILCALVRLRSDRKFNFGTVFFRNRPQLSLIRRIASRKPHHGAFRIAVLACSTGAEVYSLVCTIRQARPDLNLIVHAVDIVKDVLAFAERGVYSLKDWEFVQVPIFERLTAEEMQVVFDRKGDHAIVKSWLRNGIVWQAGDASDPGIVDQLGPQDLVIGNNFLCHMQPAQAEKCLRNMARLVDHGGHLVVSGVDLGIRTRVAHDLGWIPVLDAIEEIHAGDPSLIRDWPWRYWGLEPLNKSRPDWRMRYASVFQISRKSPYSVAPLGESSLTGSPLPESCAFF